MVKKNKSGSLTIYERRIVKALLAREWRNQDIQALINKGRKTTVNGGRITEVKQDPSQKSATDDEANFFIKKKDSIHPQTGLNLYDDERLIRAREAMILAVQIFNSAGLSFKTEVFSVLANIAWTYLLHEHYERKLGSVIQKDGRSLLLSQMIERPDFPCSDGVRNNLRSLKTIRDDVEHQLLGQIDVKWQGLFQACCLNFERAITDLFGQKLSLANELSVALQFSKMDIGQLSALNPYELPANIKATDARLIEGMSDEQIRDLEYQFTVVYTLTATSKTNANMQFIRPESAEGADIQNILVKYKSGDELYPYKPSEIPKIVEEATQERFTTHNHTQAWKFFKVRPKSRSKRPEQTKRDFCLYHPAHRDYTYSQKWIEHLIQAVQDEEIFEQIKKLKY